MIPPRALVLYKSRPAVVVETAGDKLTLRSDGHDPVKVREKDVEVLHPGPASLDDLDPPPPGDPRAAWELLSGAGGGDPVTLRDLAELTYGAFTPPAAWAAWTLVAGGLYYAGGLSAIRPRPAAEVEAEEQRRDEKRREAAERAAFMERLKAAIAKPGAGGPAAADPAATRRYLQDVEALARGLSDKSRALRELGRPETPEEAHRVLLATGAWTLLENPHPTRYGVALSPPRAVPPPPPAENRVDLTGLTAWAIDNAWSDDPDDAVSLEGPDPQGRVTLWVHVADPAAATLPGSPADIEARDRGATLYLPEGAVRMMAPEAMETFALGLTEESIALSFRIALSPALAIEDVEIHRSRVRVTRLTYEEADARIAAGDSALAALASLAERNIERRLDTGAVLFEFPETHIHVRGGVIAIEPVTPRKSAETVRECMLLAGEAAAAWAARTRIALPFVTQEAGDLPADPLPGMAGAFQIRRCMRPRALSARPGVHWGLGLDQYAQVTSPLRRYTDLLCHQQIRAALRGEPPLTEDEILLRAAAGEAAALATVKAERASRAHWIAVYLQDRKGSEWDAVLLDRKGGRGVALIPGLGVEVQVAVRGSAEPNDPLRLTLLQAIVPTGELTFGCA